jgi:DeoR/GlpR family transcriptional regulator of sugar metabolism
MPIHAYADERATRIFRLLEHMNRQDGPVPIARLVEFAIREFSVTEVTLRSDLAALCALEPVRKAARGAFEAVRSSQPDGATCGETFATRLLRRSEAKIAIAAAAANLLGADPELRALLLDAGTTAYYVAERLSELAGLDLLVWTPSLAAIGRLAGARGISVRLLGGELQPEYAAVAGDETVRALRALAGADPGGAGGPLPSFPGTTCVLDINHVSDAGGLFTDESREREQKRLMAEMAARVIVVADSSKLFDRRLGFHAHEVASLAFLAPEKRLTLITDTGASGAQRQQARVIFGGISPNGEITECEAEGAVCWTVSSG